MTPGRTWIVRRAFLLLQAAETFREHARNYYYEVSLTGCGCPLCGGGLRMRHDGAACCSRCNHTMDPTTTFQSCSGCGGPLRRRVVHYACARCGAPARSRFSFDPVRFDSHYFAEKMRQSRDQSRQRKVTIVALLQSSRSETYLDPDAPSLDQVPGLRGALDGMAGLALPGELLRAFLSNPSFDLPAYQRHILSSIGLCQVSFDSVPSLIAALYLWQDRAIRLVQYSQTLVVARYEADDER